MKKKLLKSIFRKRRKNETFFKYLIWISHFWLGLLSSIVVFVVCFTGCLYAFKNQITEIYNRDKVFVEKVSNAKKFSADDVQNQFLKNHNIKFDKVPDLFNEIQEIFSKRNLLVHNEGKVDLDYINILELY